MTNLLSLLPAAFVIGILFAGIKYMYRQRAIAMRALSARWNFQYSTGDDRMWGRRRPIRYPAGFKMKCYPIYVTTRLWNIVEGERSGIGVVIFDGMIGEGRSARCYTLIATQTVDNPFRTQQRREKIAQRAGWTGIYCIPFIGLRPWALSISRIEELLGEVFPSTAPSPHQVADKS